MSRPYDLNVSVMPQGWAVAFLLTFTRRNGQRTPHHQIGITYWPYRWVPSEHRPGKLPYR